VGHAINPGTHTKNPWSEGFETGPLKVGSRNAQFGAQPPSWNTASFQKNAFPHEGIGGHKLPLEQVFANTRRADGTSFQVFHGNHLGVKTKLDTIACQGAHITTGT